MSLTVLEMRIRERYTDLIEIGKGSRKGCVIPTLCIRGVEYV